MPTVDPVIDPNTKVTVDHDEIKLWIIKNKGRPELFEDHEGQADRKGIRVDFPGFQDEKYMNEAVELEEVGWKKFFEEFDNQGLAFAYKDDPEITDPSLRYKLIKREMVKDRLNSS